MTKTAGSYADYFHTPTPPKHFPAESITATEYNEAVIIEMVKEAKERGWTAAYLIPEKMPGGIPSHLRAFALEQFHEAGIPAVEVTEEQYKYMSGSTAMSASSSSISPATYQTNSTNSKHPVMISQTKEGTRFTCTEYTPDSIKAMVDAVKRSGATSIELLDPNQRGGIKDPELRALALREFEKMGIRAADPYVARPDQPGPRMDQTSTMNPTPQMR